MKEIIQKLLKRDLEKLKTEISSFKDEKNLWKISGDVKNSAGNLCLHLCGNLQHFVGGVLGNSGYVRHRDEEFSSKNVPLKELIDEIDITSKVVEKSLNELKYELLQAKFPINVFGYEVTTEYFLIHLATHLNYHLGQINYLRRMMNN